MSVGAMVSKYIMVLQPQVFPRFAFSRQFNYYGSVYSEKGVAQAFSVGAAAVSVKTLYLFTRGNAAKSIIASIREVDANNDPTGAALVSAEFNVANGIMAGGNASFPVYKHTIFLPVGLLANTNYAIVALFTSEVGLFRYWLHFRTSGWDTQYPKDQGSSNYITPLKKSTDGGVTWSDLGPDFMAFELRGQN